MSTEAHHADIQLQVHEMVRDNYASSAGELRTLRKLCDLEGLAAASLTPRRPGTSQRHSVHD